MFISQDLLSLVARLKGAFIIFTHALLPFSLSSGAGPNPWHRRLAGDVAPIPQPACSAWRGRRRWNKAGEELAPNPMARAHPRGWELHQEWHVGADPHILGVGSPQPVLDTAWCSPTGSLQVEASRRMSSPPEPLQPLSWWVLLAPRCRHARVEAPQFLPPWLASCPKTNCPPLGCTL